MDRSTEVSCCYPQASCIAVRAVLTAPIPLEMKPESVISLSPSLREIPYRLDNLLGGLGLYEISTLNVMRLT